MEQTVTPATTIEQLYHHHHQPILHYLDRLVSDRETAEDLCHETFIKALWHWNELEQAALARSWLCRIARHRLRLSPPAAACGEHAAERRTRSGIGARDTLRRCRAGLGGVEPSA
jgi:hypothetical protein